jgi:hypothetical protein
VTTPWRVRREEYRSLNWEEVRGLVITVLAAIDFQKMSDRYVGLLMSNKSGEAAAQAAVMLSVAWLRVLKVHPASDDYDVVDAFEKFLIARDLAEYPTRQIAGLLLVRAGAAFVSASIPGDGLTRLMSQFCLKAEPPEVHHEYDGIPYRRIVREL